MSAQTRLHLTCTATAVPLLKTVVALQALRVPINNGDEDHYTSPDFEAAGHTW